MRRVRGSAVIAAVVVLGAGLVGAIGVSGDGIEQDDAVAAAAYVLNR